MHRISLPALALAGAMLFTCAASHAADAASASAASAPAAAAPGAPPVVLSAYKHLAQWQDDAAPVITVAPQGVRMPYLADGARRFGRAALSWAFASGECGDEVWGSVSGAQIAAANVAAFAQAGIGYIVSTGGQGHMFTCASDEGMERFISRYDTPALLGIDFDIEEGQTAAQIDALVGRAVVAQQRRPALRFSFTVATHAASDGSLHSLNTLGETVLASVRQQGLRNYTFNLMVMDYGPATRKVCVLRKGRCDMGRSALQAAHNVHRKYGIPYNQIELTPMLGVNDVVENVFTVADMQRLARAVAQLKLAGLHYWSLDRDTPCRQPVKGADALCSGMAGVPAGAYLRAMGAGAAERQQ
ncbi:glycosyl hydrolase [Pseudoduganella danionis]|uniref:glycosyl hydrolase n=1 Tax=Pseudoduganella danionis TaxID=1890295 RepID=UPI0035B0F29D